MKLDFLPTTSENRYKALIKNFNDNYNITVFSGYNLLYKCTSSTTTVDLGRYLPSTRCKYAMYDKL